MKQLIDNVFGGVSGLIVMAIICLMGLAMNFSGAEGAAPLLFFGMTALAADKKIEYTDGVELGYPVINGDIIYAGALTCVNAAGYALPGSDTAGLIFIGVSREHADNHDGAAGDIKVTVRRKGVFKMTLATAISIANTGDKVYLVDDQTVDLAANCTNDICCGTIAGYIDSTHAWVDIEQT
jgi:hypothetical protein